MIDKFSLFSVLKGYTALLFLVFACCCQREEIKPGNQNETLLQFEEELVADLDQNLIDLPSEPLYLSDGDLAFLDYFADKRIVALGEATHGTKEFFEMKHRIFQYLVENHGHVAFAFEADFAESWFINEYIRSGVGALEPIMKEKMHFWTWTTHEVRALLEWMRSYNIAAGDGKGIGYYGFDCQYMTFQPILLYHFLESRSDSLHQQAQTIIGKVLIRDEEGYQGMTDDEHDQLQADLQYLIDVFESDEEFLIAASDLPSYRLHKHLIRNLQQVLQVKYAYAIHDISKNWRDHYMAENAVWIADFLGDQKKITLWAHNGHVSKGSKYVAFESMGNRLAKLLGDDYAVIGFGFSEGRFTAVTKIQDFSHGLQTQEIRELPKRTSTNFLFHHVAHEDFALNLTTLSENTSWYNYFQNDHLFLSIGAVYNRMPTHYYSPVILNAAYDWLFYFRKTEAAQQL
jgi:erythromycin esterase